MKITRFEDTKCWKEARKLNGLIYEITSEGNFAKDFGLRDQIRRAAVSCMSNIAEGFVSQGNKSFVRYLFISLASAAEVKSQLYVALDQNYISSETFKKCSGQCDATAKVLSGFIKYLQRYGKTEPHEVPN